MHQASALGGAQLPGTGRFDLVEAALDYEKTSWSRCNCFSPAGVPKSRKYRVLCRTRAPAQRR
jgi:hypothetical protein